MKKKLCTLLLMVAVCLGTMGIGLSAADIRPKADTGISSVYFEAGDATELTHLVDAETTAVLGKDANAYGNPDVEGAYSNARIITTGQAVYSFDFADATSRAAMSIYANNYIKVQYSIAGGGFLELAPDNNNLPNPGVSNYYLTESNVFAASNTTKEFKLRFYSANNSTPVNLSRLMIRTNTESTIAEGETIKIVSDSKEEMEYSHTNYGFYRRYDSTTTYWSANETYERFLVFKFDFPDIATGVRFNYENGPWGVASAVSFSLDNSVYTPLTDNEELNAKLADSSDKVFYIKFLSQPGSEAYLRSLSLTLLSVGQAPVAGEPQDEVLFNIDSAAENAYLLTAESSAYTDIEQDNYSDGSGGVVNKVRKLGVSSHVVYGIKLKPELNLMTLNLYGSANMVVAYSTDNGLNYNTLTAKNTEISERGILRYALTSSDALSNSDKSFRLKIYSTGDYTYLRGLAIVNPAAEAVTGSADITPLSNSEIRYYYDSQKAIRRFAKTPAEEVFFWLKDIGSSITFRFNFPDAQKNLIFSYGLGNWGAAPVTEISLNGTDYTAVLNGDNINDKIAASSDNVFYIKFSRAAAGETYLKSISIRTVTAATNPNPNVPQDQTEAYFMAGSTEEANNFFGTAETFNSTHSGMGTDGYEGGYYKNNARVLKGTDYVLYEFDLIDTATTARLKILGGGVISVSSSTDNLVSFVPLNIENTAGVRGYSIINLTGSDALKESNNRFALRVASNDGVITSLYISTEEEEISKSVYITPENMSGLKYLDNSRMVNRFYAHEYFYSLYLNNQDSFIEYKFDLSDSINRANLSLTYAGSFKISAKSEGGSYAELFTSTLSDSMGDYATNLFELDSVLADNAQKIFYIKIEREGTRNGLISDIGIGIPEKNLTSGDFSVYEKNEINYLNKIPVDDAGIATARMYNADKGAKIVYGRVINEYMIYKLDLVDTADRMSITLDISGIYDVYVSKDGMNYEKAYRPLMGLAGPHTFGVYDVFNGNDSNTVYIKLAKAGENALRLKSMSFTTENVPDMSADSDIDEGDRFDYDKPSGTLPGEIELGEAPVAPKPTKPSLTGGAVAGIAAGSSVGGVLIIGGGAVAAILILKKKKNANKTGGEQ